LTHGDRAAYAVSGNNAYRNKNDKVTSGARLGYRRFSVAAVFFRRRA
jgi:hypothetical protein